MEPRMTPVARSHSLKLEVDRSANRLSQSLASVAAEEQQEIQRGELSEAEWRSWLDDGESFSDEDHERLSDRCKEAIKLWKELCRRLHNGSNSEVFTIPTLKKLSAATNKMISDRKSNHESGFHAAKESFLNFVTVMSDYSYIFSIFPSGDKYTSLITGVLSTIAKAAANHRRTTDMFSTALDDITESLRLISKYRIIVQTTDARRHYIDIYPSIFEFLCFAMSWYGSRGKRFWSAVNKNFIDNDVNPKIDAVKKAVARFYAETRFVTADEVHKMAPQIDNLRSDLMDDLRDLLSDQLDEFRLGGYTADYPGTVQEHATHENDDSRALIGSEIDQIKSSELAGPPSNVESGPLLKHHEDYGLTNIADRHHVPVISVETEIFATMDRLISLIDDGRNSLIEEHIVLTEPILPEEVIVQMQYWIRNPTSSMLWVEGVEVYSGPLLSMAALCIHSTFEATGVTCISHFCRYPFRSHSELGSEEALFISFLYSIVVQLSEILEVDFSTSANKEKRDCLNQLDAAAIQSSNTTTSSSKPPPQGSHFLLWARWKAQRLP